MGTGRNQIWGVSQEWRAKRSALLGRMDFVGGSFFEAATLPPPAPASRDAYMLRCVLHDWNDAKTLDILRSLRTAIGALRCPWLQGLHGLRDSPRVKTQAVPLNTVTTRLSRSGYCGEKQAVRS